MAKELPKAKKGWEWQPEKSKGRPEKELDYYDCPFGTDLRLEDFSKEFLIKLMRIWQMQYMRMPQYWHSEITKRVGRDVADEIMPEIWVRLGKTALPMYAPLLGPNYKTVADCKTLEDFMKVGHLPPDGGIDPMLFQGNVEWKNENLAIATVTHCISLEYLERTNQPERIHAMCHVAEPRGTEAYFIDPRIRITGLKIPPRKNPGTDEPCCIWEYRMMDTPQRDPQRRWCNCP